LASSEKPKMCKDCNDFYPLTVSDIDPTDLADDSFARSVLLGSQMEDNGAICINYFSLLELSQNKKLSKVQPSTPSYELRQKSRSGVDTKTRFKTDSLEPKACQGFSSETLTHNVPTSFFCREVTPEISRKVKREEDDVYNSNGNEIVQAETPDSKMSTSVSTVDSDYDNTVESVVSFFTMDEEASLGNLSIHSKPPCEDFVIRTRSNDEFENVKGSGIPDGTLVSTLLESSDRTLVSDFTNAIVNEMQVTSFNSRDRKGKRSSFPSGYAGMSCRHCDGKVGRTGRYFPSSVKTISDSKKSLYAMYKHLSKCSQCPDDVKLTLGILFQKHTESRKRNRRQGTQRAYFRKIWLALHPVDHEIHSL
jgi:hypothetical protein